MEERPILFSEPMVQAVLEGRKTQTRRLVKPQPTGDTKDLRLKDELQWYMPYDGPLKQCPYGQVGDRLWVRENWAVHSEVDNLAPRHIDEDRSVFYPADEACTFPYDAGCYAGRTRPSIHMPRWASRILLEVTDVRVERLQDIRDHDVAAEGCNIPEGAMVSKFCDTVFGSPIASIEPQNEKAYQPHFKELWESINGKGSWDENPWLWVVEFKVVEVKS